MPKTNLENKPKRYQESRVHLNKNEEWKLTPQMGLIDKKKLTSAKSVVHMEFRNIHIWQPIGHWHPSSLLKRCIKLFQTEKENSARDKFILLDRRLNFLSMMMAGEINKQTLYTRYERLLYEEYSKLNEQELRKEYENLKKKGGKLLSDLNR